MFCFVLVFAVSQINHLNLQNVRKEDCRFSYARRTRTVSEHFIQFYRRQNSDLPHDFNEVSFGAHCPMRFQQN